MTLSVNEIFYSIQGEGPYIGHPSVFVRLAGCNLDCGFCDTAHEEGHPMSIADILKSAESAVGGRVSPFAHLFVLTGGEPLKQDLRGIVGALTKRGFSIQIETNGTLCPEPEVLALLKEVTVVCSPKPGHPPSPHLAPYIDAYKVLVRAGASDGIFEAFAYAMSGRPIYIQPVDEGSPDANKKNMARAIELCKKEGFLLSPQLHKLVGVK